MTPDMVRRVEFLREAAAQGYTQVYAAAELGVPPSVIRATCREYKIEMVCGRRIWRQTHSRRTIRDNGGRGWEMPVTQEDYDFLPDVGEV